MRSRLVCDSYSILVEVVSYSHCRALTNRVGMPRRLLLKAGKVGSMRRLLASSTNQLGMALRWGVGVWESYLEKMGFVHSFFLLQIWCCRSRGDEVNDVDPDADNADDDIDEFI